MARTDEQHGNALRERLNAAHEKVADFVAKATAANTAIQGHAEELRMRIVDAEKGVAAIRSSYDEARQAAAHAGAVLAELQRVAQDIKALRAAF